MFIALYDAPKSDSAAKQWMWIVTLHPKQDRNQELFLYHNSGY